jgi:hypothetical protein
VDAVEGSCIIRGFDSNDHVAFQSDTRRVIQHLTKLGDLKRPENVLLEVFADIGCFGGRFYVPERPETEASGLRREVHHQQQLIRCQSDRGAMAQALDQSAGLRRGAAHKQR